MKVQHKQSLQSRRLSRYYHGLVQKTLVFIIPKKMRILFIGSYDGRVLANLSPSIGVGVESGEDACKKAKKRYPKLQFVNKEYKKYKPRGKFDYIVLNGALGKTDDLVGLIKNLQKACHPSTRLLVYQHNHLWQWILTLAESLGLKRKEGIHNWLSVSDVSVYLKGAGFEVTRVFRRTLCPVSLFGLGPFVNWISTILPIFDFAKLDQYLLARPDPSLFPTKLPKSLTVCITVRNEQENIEPIVRSLPEVCKNQEILFVEGGSTDGTRKEIQRIIRAYPQKNVRVTGQPGKGQGSAIRVGFKKARGDIIILYEGDGTSEPEDLKYFYETMKKGYFEFIEGSRFVYPLDSNTMPLVKQFGNIFFAKWFSFFLGQTTTDVLSGIKAVLKRDYQLLYDRWGFLGIDDPFGDFELLYGAARTGLRFGEIPMRYYPRTYGESKTQIFGHGLYLLNMAFQGYFLFRQN